MRLLRVHVIIIGLSLHPDIPVETLSWNQVKVMIVTFGSWKIQFNSGAIYSIQKRCLFWLVYQMSPANRTRSPTIRAKQTTTSPRSTFQWHAHKHPDRTNPFCPTHKRSTSAKITINSMVDGNTVLNKTRSFFMPRVSSWLIDHLPQGIGRKCFGL